MAEEILYQYKHGNATIIVMKPEITDPEETERRRQATRELAGRLYWEQVHENRRRAEMAAQAQKGADTSCSGASPAGRP